MCKLWVGSHQLASQSGSAQAAQVDMGGGEAKIGSRLSSNTMHLQSLQSLHRTEWIRQTDLFAQ